jgi:hypothetical protein
MRKFYLFLLSAIAFSAFSQNWAPINTTEKFCYSHFEKTGFISNVLWVVSYEQNGDDQIYHLNKIARPVEDQDFDYLVDEPQFLLDDIIVKPNGDWIFIDTFLLPNPLDIYDTLFLKPQASLGETWDFTDGIEASVTYLDETNIFGEPDSTKKISLSDGNFIILSKNHGIINWQGEYFLEGIEGRDLGLIVPDFDDLYADVSEGDVACIHTSQWQADETVEGWWKKTRLDISSVVRYSDSIVIIADVHSKFHQYWKSDVILSKSIQTFVFYRDRYTEKYPNDTMRLEHPNFFIEDLIVVSKLDEHEWGGIKKSQVVLDSWNTNLVYCPGLYGNEFCSDYWTEFVLFEQSVRFGFLEMQDEGFEWGGSDKLVGYIDNGVEYGEIYPLDMFVGTNQLTSNSNWLVYPNPTNDKVQLQSFQIGNITYQIFNYSGILIYEQPINKTDKEISIPVDGLSAGVYLLKLIQNNQTEVLKFVKE